MPERVAALRRAAALGRLAALYARHLAGRGAGVLARRGAASPTGRGAGLAAFDALYRPDRITALSPADREGLAGQGWCVACGLCDFAAPRAGYLRADRLPSQLTRSLPDLWAARDLALDDVDWAAAAAVCPTGVPLEAMPGFVRDRLRQDGVEPPAPRRPAPPPAGAAPGRWPWRG